MSTKKTGRMPRHRNGWVSLWSGPALPTIGAVFVAGASFYYLTQYTLNTHTEQIKLLESKLDAKSLDDVKNRDTIRKDFIENATKTAEGIALLNTKAAVQEETTKNMAATLAKISDQLTEWNAKRR